MIQNCFNSAARLVVVYFAILRVKIIPLRILLFRWCELCSTTTWHFLKYMKTFLPTSKLIISLQLLDNQVIFQDDIRNNSSNSFVCTSCNIMHCLKFTGVLPYYQAQNLTSCLKVLHFIIGINGLICWNYFNSSLYLHLNKYRPKGEQLQHL